MKWIKGTERLPPEPGVYFVKSKAHGKIIINIEELDSAKIYFNNDDCEWLDEQDEGWVPVGERLPEKRIRVNACLDGDIVFIGHLDFNGQWVLEEWDLAKDGSGQSKVTHWQPLPKPPATKD